jgi:hypothetical protein
MPLGYALHWRLEWLSKCTIYIGHHTSIYQGAAEKIRVDPKGSIQGISQKLFIKLISRGYLPLIWKTHEIQGLLLVLLWLDERKNDLIWRVSMASSA